jgi:acetylornithine deacetylase/succinyl-diaminopimelate desuccinylase-like protein
MSGMAITVREFDPDEESGSRSEMVDTLAKLRPYQCIIINPIEENTRQQVYTAASRLRKSIRTKVTSVGLKIWLKDQPPKRVVDEIPVAETKEDKLAALRRMMEPTVEYDEGEK